MAEWMAAAACAVMLAAMQPTIAQNHVVTEKIETAVYFDYGRSELGSAGQLLVREMAAKARSAGLTRVTITGHTDKAGTEEQNLRDGLKRAEAVAAILQEAGFSPRRITVTSAGESKPARRHEDERREPLNRRAEIRFEP